MHHANIRIDRTAATRQLDDADPLPGYDGLMPRSAEYPDGHFLGWTPGQVAPLVQPELAWTLEPGSDLVVQLHMQPSGAVEEVRPEIGFYFSDRAAARARRRSCASARRASTSRRAKSRYVIRDSYVLPVDVELLAVQPHAHYRAQGDPRHRDACPTARRARVMHIKDWDFRWQHVYRQDDADSRCRRARGCRWIHLRQLGRRTSRNPRAAAGARVLGPALEATRWATSGSSCSRRTTRDRARLNAEITAKMTGEDIVGYETMLKVTPNDAELHDDVALLYLGLGFAANAVRHFQASAALKPESAPAHFNLGTALAQAGRFDDSVTAFRDALSRRPDYALAHGNLGRVLLVKGDVGEALKHLQEAVRLDPNNPQSLLGLSEALAQRGAFDRAIETLERAMQAAADRTRSRARSSRSASSTSSKPSSTSAHVEPLAAGSTAGCRRDDLLDQRLRAAPTSAGPADTTTPCRRDRSSRRSASSRRRTSSTTSSLTGADTVFIHG